MRALDWDPDGHGKVWTALRHPLSIGKVEAIGDRGGEAWIATEEFVRSIGYHGTRHNDFVDAFRHAYASYRMTQEVGADTSKDFMDLHERTDPNPWRETAMDLWNNAVGRSLATDPKNAGRKPAEVIREALDKGLLMTHEFGLTTSPTQKQY
jgi:hypothetical protein